MKWTKWSQWSLQNYAELWMPQRKRTPWPYVSAPPFKLLYIDCIDGIPLISNLISKHGWLLPPYRRIFNEVTVYPKWWNWVPGCPAFEMDPLYNILYLWSAGTHCLWWPEWACGWLWEHLIKWEHLPLHTESWWYETFFFIWDCCLLQCFQRISSL